MSKRIESWMGVWVGLMLCGSSVLSAAEAESLDAILRQKGIITDAEYESLKAPPLTHSSSPSVQIGGRLNIDAAVYDSDEVDLSSGTEIRRARLFAKGKIGTDWFYKAQYDFTSAGIEGIRDFYIGYGGLTDGTILRVGHFVEYGSLEDSTSSRYITFMERASPILAFQPAGRRIGMGVDVRGTSWYAGAGVFGENAAIDETEDDGIGTSARLSFAPVHGDRHVVHAGLSGRWRQPGGDTLRYQARPESHVSDIRILDTLVISNVADVVTYGLEAAWVFGPVSVQGEYMGVAIHRNGYPDEDYDGYYVTGSWFLTGESRPYNPAYGAFGRLCPKRCVGDGGWGAWEAAARLSNLDVSGHVSQSKSENVTLGLNWYTTPYIRFTLNYVHSSIFTTEQGDVDIDILQMRAQLDF